MLSVNAPQNIQDDASYIAQFNYTTTHVEQSADGGIQVTPQKVDLTLKTDRTVPRLGVMLVGFGGNNGSTFLAGVLANKQKLSWRTKEAVETSNWFGSITQASTVRLGANSTGEEIYVPMKDMMPMVAPDDLVVTGWDISRMNLADAMERAAVLPVDLQRQLRPEMEKITPMPSCYYPDFIASNQAARADNVMPGETACWAHVEALRTDIREFKKANGLDKVIVLWTANTERFCEVTKGIHDTAENLVAAIKRGHEEISQSTVFATAAILEGCSYINGSPQNTNVPGVIELAAKHGVFVGGDDFKSGQTKIKSVLVDFLVSAGIKPESIVSYNHLGNNDGKNLSEQKTFRSKEISKSNVVDDVVASNSVLYPDVEKDHPDHCVVIKYVPFVGDSKRAMDEYTSRIFMNGRNTLVIHNTCEDSLLATPIILDLVLLTELLERIQYKRQDQPDSEYAKMRPVLSVLSYLLKAPMVNADAPVVNALFRQRDTIVNLFRACRGLPIESNLLLEHKMDLGKMK